MNGRPRPRRGNTGGSPNHAFASFAVSALVLWPTVVGAAFTGLDWFAA
jgi:hypothetical protein